MSDSRIDYQPLSTRGGQDSPVLSRHSNDGPKLEHTNSSNHEEDEDEYGIHATESQGLVSPSSSSFADRDFVQHQRQQQEGEEEGQVSKKDAKAAAAEWAVKVQAFLCAALLGVSTHFTSHMTGPLKDVLKENMGINNTQFSLLQSSLTLFPTLTPLIGGLLIERYGTGPSSIVFTTIVIAGQAIVILGCWTHSIKIMILGYCLFGLGAAPITIIQETIWVRYFKKDGLALVLALGLTSGKLAGFLALATSVPLSTVPPFGFVTPFFVSLIISSIAWVMNIVFLTLLEKPKEGVDTVTKITILLKAKRTNLGWREVYGFSTMFWTLLTISFLVGASWNPFMHQSSNIVKHRYGLDDEQAAWQASIILAVPLIIYPFLGSFIDHAGKRAWMLLITAGLLICTHIILLIPYSTIPIPPTVPMLLFALSLSLGTLSIVTSMPVLTKHVPTGLGLHKSIDNIGATLFGTVAGMMQDFSGSIGPDGESDTENFFDRLYHHFFPVHVDEALQEKEDTRLLGLFLAVAILAFIACSVFVWGDYHWTDGEGGKTGLVNGVYGKNATTTTSRHRRRNRRHRERRIRRRSHEVLEAMALEPIFELDDEQDAEEVIMTEIGANNSHLQRDRDEQHEYHLSSYPATPGSRTRESEIDSPSSGQLLLGDDRRYNDRDRLRRSSEFLSSPDGSEDGDSEGGDSEDENGERRFGVRIESGDDEVPHYKKVQAHFWIIFWSILLVTSWAVFGIGGGQRRFISEALLREDCEVVEAVAKKALEGRSKNVGGRSKKAEGRRKAEGRSKAEGGEDAVATVTTTTTTKKVSKPRTKKATSSQLSKDEVATDIVETVVKTRKKKSTKSKETPEAAAVPVVAEETASTQAAVVATKVKRKASKKSSSSATADTAPTPEPVKTQLRPYQQECIDACLENLKNGIMRQIVIFSHLMKQVPAPFPGANKTLILAHRQELLEQTRNHVLRNGTGLRVTIDQGKRVADMTADVIVASVPTLGRAGTTRILKYNPQDFKCIIIDEAHHAAADSYGRILEHFGAHVPDTHIFVYGCSATVRRHDGLRLGGVFDHISFHKGFITMIEDKWLCGLRVSTIKTEFDLQNVKTQGGDFATKDLSEKVNTPVRNDIIVRSYMTYCGARKSTVVFAVDIAHLESLTETFRKYGYDARGLSSKTDDVTRAQMLKDFKDQKFPVIVNCGILTEGTDIPVIDSIIMARPTKSNVLFQQMLGRGMRLHPGKEDCLVLDFVDVVRGDGLVTLPTLLGLDASDVLNEDVTINNHEDVDAIRDGKIAALEADATSQFPDETEVVEEIDPSTGLKVARIRVLEYENPYQLIGDCSGANRRVAAMSPNAWVNVGGGAYVLTCQEISFRIEKSEEDGLYQCLKRVTMDNRQDKDGDDSSMSMLQKLKQARFKFLNPRRSQSSSKDKGTSMFQTKESKLPIQADTLEDCFHGVDTWISRNIGHFPGILSRFAKWRKLPASESQLRFLRKLGYDHDPLEAIGGGEAGLEGGVGAVEEDGTVSVGSLMKELKLKEKKRKEAEARKLTKGQAANMITRLVHGAGKRWTESKKFEVKKAKALAKEIGVEVGPIPKFVDI
ncbi:hypothetical protein EC991_011180 [Linnemannia zychae]|nr:hypothetical protein EC991_011180 [Linnemannia zychae]